MGMVALRREPGAAGRTHRQAWEARLNDRQRRYRKRRAKGQVVYRITADDRLLHALIRAGRLEDRQTANRVQVEAELNALVERWLLEFGA